MPVCARHETWGVPHPISNQEGGKVSRLTLHYTEVVRKERVKKMMHGRRPMRATSYTSYFLLLLKYRRNRK